MVSFHRRQGEQILRPPNVVDGDQVRVLEARGCAALAEEALELIW